MDIVEFEKEVMHLFRKHYAGTEKISEKNWFKINVHSLYKEKGLSVHIIDELNAMREATISGIAETYDELFIETLFLLRDHLLKHPYKNVLCSSCKGKGEFEQSAGSHSYFEKCNKCDGTGKAKELS